MTQTTEDPFAAAQATINQNAPAPAASVQQAQPTSGMAGGFGGALGSSRLFEQGGRTTVLMNKTHPVGTSRSGIITATEDKQDRDMNARALKFWSLSKTGGETKNRATTTDAVDGPTGKPNDPVIVTHVSLNTEYRLDVNEAIAIGRDASAVSEDDGRRVEIVGHRDYKAFRDAMLDARSRGIALNGPQDLVGKRLTVTRASQTPNPGGNPFWNKAYRIDNA